MAVVLRPPFWVPKPPDDQPWQMKMEWMNSGVLQQLTKPKMYGAGGQVPTKRWAPFYAYNSSDPPPWTLKIEWMNSAVIQQLTKPKVYGAPGQVPTKRWAPYLTENDPPPWQMLLEWMDSEAILHTAPFKPTPWRLYYDDYSVWTGVPIGPLDTLYGVNNPVKPIPWRLNYDDASGWQGEPQSTSLALTALQPPSPPPQMSPLWAPRPPDDNIQSPTSAGVPINLLTAAPTPTHPFRWNYTLDDPPAWQMPSEWMNSGVIQELARITFPLFTPYLWRLQYTQNDASGWQGESINSATLQLLTAPGKAPTFTFRFGLDDGAYWQGAPVARNTPLYLAETFSNRKTWWYAEDPVWSGEPINSSVIQILTAAGQAKPFRWNWGLDESAPWQQPKGFNLTLNTVITNPFSNRWTWWYPDEASVWMPTINLNLNIVLGSSFPGTISFYVNTPLDDPTWQQPKGFNKVLNTVFGNPFTRRPPQWYAEDAPWTGAPSRSEIIRLLTFGGTPPTPRYQFNYDDASLWLGVPTRSQIIRLLTVGGQPPTPHYQFNYDDASAWIGAPIGISPYRLVSFTPTTARSPQFYSEDAYWLGSSTARNINLVGVNPFTARPPQFYSEDALWSGQPIGRNTALYLVEPFSIRQSVTYFEDSLWSWQARRSSVISLLTVGGKVKPFRANFTYDDAASWEPTIPTNLILLTTKFPKPFNLSSLWFNAHMFYDIDAPGWPGYPIAAFRSGVPPPPPPRTQFYEWIIRARRRGRR